MNILTLRQVCEQANKLLPAQADKSRAGISGLAMLLLDATKWFCGNNTALTRDGENLIHKYRGYEARFRPMLGARAVYLMVAMDANNPIRTLLRRDERFICNEEPVIRINRSRKDSAVLLPVSDELADMEMTELIQRGINTIEARIAKVVKELSYVDKVLSQEDQTDFFRALYWSTVWLPLNGGWSQPGHAPNPDAASMAEAAETAWDSSIFNPNARRAILDNDAIQHIIRTSESEGE